MKRAGSMTWWWMSPESPRLLGRTPCGRWPPCPLSKKRQRWRCNTSKGKRLLASKFLNIPEYQEWCSLAGKCLPGSVWNFRPLLPHKAKWCEGINTSKRMLRLRENQHHVSGQCQGAATILTWGNPMQWQQVWYKGRTAGRSWLPCQTWSNSRDLGWSKMRGQWRKEEFEVLENSLTGFCMVKFSAGSCTGKRLISCWIHL